MYNDGMTTTTIARHLIVTVTHDDELDAAGNLIAQGYTDERDAGPATADQIAASDRAATYDGGCGIFTLDDGRTAYVEAE